MTTLTSSRKRSRTRRTIKVAPRPIIATGEFVRCIANNGQPCATWTANHWLYCAPSEQPTCGHVKGATDGTN